MHILQGDDCSRFPFLYINIYLSAACWNYKPMWYSTPLQGREWQNILMQATGGGKGLLITPLLCNLGEERWCFLSSRYPLSIEYQIYATGFWRPLGLRCVALHSYRKSGWFWMDSRSFQQNYLENHPLILFAK